MTHQLVRHRLMSVCQESQRYVEEDDFGYVMPPAVSGEYVEDFQNDMNAIAKMYAKWRQRGLKKEDARFVLPNACASNIVITANFREWRHIFSVRLEKAAQWEIRMACEQILEILRTHAPGCFYDI
jgi:thymidylate synthase (FAD)